MQQTNQVPATQGDISSSQPVPKENISAPNSPELQGQQTIPAQTEVANQTVPVAQESKSVPMVESAQPAKPEKKKKGLINKTTCCIGSCVGCLLILVIIVLLGIFAAPTLSKYLNKLINPGIDAPEVKDVDMTDIDNEINDMLSEAGTQAITITEDEFNQMLKRKYNPGTDEAAINMDVRSDFEENEAKILMKFTKWMPWALVEVSNDSEGKLSTNTMKLGPLDISNFVKGTMEENFEGEDFSGEINVSSLFVDVVFGDDATRVEVTSIYFGDDEFDMNVVIEDKNYLEE